MPFRMEASSSNVRSIMFCGREKGRAFSSLAASMMIGSVSTMIGFVAVRPRREEEDDDDDDDDGCLEVSFLRCWKPSSLFIEWMRSKGRYPIIWVRNSKISSISMEGCMYSRPTASNWFLFATFTRPNDLNFVLDLSSYSHEIKELTIQSIEYEI